jgi:hypothetical protein
MAHHSIRLLPFRRREVLRGRPLRTPPIALANEERTPNSPRIDLSAVLLNQILLCLYNTASLAFIIDTNDFAADLECLAGGCRREGFQEGKEPLAVDDAARVEFGDARDGVGGLSGVEVDYFLGGLLECWGKLGIVFNM